MPEVLYRDDVNKFSVYRLRDIPDGVPRSGAAPIDWWHSGEYARCLGWLNGNWLQAYTKRGEFLPGTEALCCAVLDECSGQFIVKPPKAARASYRAEIRDAESHAENTWYLGAHIGERLPALERTSEAWSAAWSAHLRFLINQSAQRDRDRTPTVLMPHDED